MPEVTRTKYLEFVQVRDTGRTKSWAVASATTGVPLGVVTWHSPWRRYGFMPTRDTFFDAACLNDLAAFIAARMDERAKVRRG